MFFRMYLKCVFENVIKRGYKNVKKVCINPDSRTRLEAGVVRGGWGGGGYDVMVVCSEVVEQKIQIVVFHF